MPEDMKDAGASERARLLNLARKTGQSHDLLLTRYARERLLYRLAQTDPIPTEIPDGLKPEFYEDRAKIAQWRAFIEDVAVDPGSLANVVAVLSKFLMSAAHKAAAQQC